MKVLKVIVTNATFWGMMENGIEFFEVSDDKLLEDFVLEELREDYDEEDIKEMMEDSEKLEFESDKKVNMFFEEGMCSWYLVENNLK